MSSLISVARVLSVAWIPLASGCVHHHYYAPETKPEGEPSPSADVSECSPLLPAPEALSESHAVYSEPPRDREEGAKSNPPAPREAVVISHEELKKHDSKGAHLVGLATRSLGSTNIEIWRVSIPVGGQTPTHLHDSEEIFIVLRGKGELHVGSEVLSFEAPVTLIAPASVSHFVKNTGEEATDHLVVVPIGSSIHDEAGKPMVLPWRE